MTRSSDYIAYYYVIYVVNAVILKFHYFIVNGFLFVPQHTHNKINLLNTFIDHQDEENKAVSRLKRYIALCGVRRNYKKLLDGCRSVKAKVAVLKKELEELGVEG